MRSFWRLMLIFGLLLLVFGWLRWQSRVVVEPGSVLIVELGGEYVEAPDPPLLARMLGKGFVPLARVRDLFVKAERDSRLERVVIKITPLEIGWAKAQELRDGITRLRDAGRHPVAYLEIESFGSSLEYYVASAAEEVYVAPATRMPFVGLAAEFLFLGGFWEKLGIEVEAERIGDYKTAVDSLAGKTMSDAHREVANALLDSIEAQFTQSVSTSRGVTQEDVRSAMQEGLVSLPALQERRLIDGVLSFEALLEKYGQNLQRLSESQIVFDFEYAAVPASEVGWDPQAKFALIYATGNVVTGEAPSSLSGGPVAAADTIVEAIQTAVEDPEIEAIVLRVDSPGGSPLASDLIWQAVAEARKAGKPVVASFSDLAASGGYYLACGADRIVVESGTLTGSIGVFVLRPVIAGLLDKLDIGHETLVRGQHAEMLLSTKKLSPASRRKLQEDVSSVYDLFLERVASGRSMAKQEVDVLARGRVWAGTQAVEKGLADRVGGLREAVFEAKQLASIPEADDVSLIVYPPPKPLPVQLAEALNGQVALAPRAELLPLPPLLKKTARIVETWPEPLPLLVLPYVIEIR